MILNLTLSRAGPGLRNRATRGLFSTVKTVRPYSTGTRAAGASTRRVAGVALFKGENMQDLIDALQALIFYADRIAPDLPDTALADNFQIALDRARQALDKGQN